MRIEEFGPERDWWNQREENEHAWRVSIDEIKARNYNLDIKNPHDPGGEDHDPDQLLADYAQLQGEIAATRDQLKAILSSALSGA